MFDAGLEIADGLSQLSDQRAATSHELHSDEAHNLAHHRTMRGAVYCSETLRLMSVQGQKRHCGGSGNIRLSLKHSLGD